MPSREHRGQHRDRPPSNGCGAAKDSPANASAFHRVPFSSLARSIISPRPRSVAQPLDEFRQVRRKRHLEVHRLARDRMYESQLHRAQGQARGAALVGAALTKQRLGVNLLAAQADDRFRPDECESGGYGRSPGGIR